MCMRACVCACVCVRWRFSQLSKSTYAVHDWNGILLAVIQKKYGKYGKSQRLHVLMFDFFYCVKPTVEYDREKKNI